MSSKLSPKVELHCHLDGILDYNMLLDIQQEDPSFPIIPGEFKQAYPVTNFESFINWWNFTKPIEGKLKYFRPIISKHIERLRAQNVKYSEIMIPCGKLLSCDKIKTVERVSLFRDWVDNLESDDIQVEFLIVCGRNRSSEELEERVERILLLHENGLIAGVALAGLEKGYPVKPLHKFFTRLHEAGIRIEIHAGEWAGPESVWDALEYGYPDRIGHGVSLFQDEKLIEIIKERQIHIEMCPTSNLKTGSVSRIKEHPVQKAREIGLNFSINTDDPGPLGCSMESEYELLSEVFGFENDDFQRIYVNSLAARFQS